MFKADIIKRLLCSHKYEKVYEGDNVVIDKGNHSVWDFPGYWIIVECKDCKRQNARDTHGRTYAQVLSDYISHSRILPF